VRKCGRAGVRVLIGARAGKVHSDVLRHVWAPPTPPLSLDSSTQADLFAETFKNYSRQLKSLLKTLDMALPFLVAIDILNQTSTGLSAEDLSRLGNAYLTVTPANVDDTISYIFSNFSHYSISVNVTALTDNALIMSLLDAGAARVFVNQDQLQALQETVDDSRLALTLTSEVHSKERIINAIANTSVGIYAHRVTNVDFITGWLQEYGTTDKPPVFVSFGAPPTLETAVAIGKLAATPIISREFLTTDPQKNPDHLPVAEIFTASITSDRADKLISTIVVDEQGVALGLVYSSPESVKESLRTGTGVYQSRKRGLWYKGATSGAVQELVRIGADCDQDCLRFFVKQKGAGEATAHSRC
jgi:phosphoribosyl-AMP cyclohydrolase